MPPAIQPGDYSTTDYTDDLNGYKDAMDPETANPALAKQYRNNIAYGLMALIDVVYGDYYNRLFSRKNLIAVSGDAITLGLSSAASIATHAATKTILSALGTGFAGLNLSIDKNYFAQQTFPVIGVAMQTRRDKVRTEIIKNLALDTTTYPLLAVKRDLVAYLSAGTLASGLQELQEEAGSATKPAPQGPTQLPAPASLSAVPKNATEISLLWAPVTGATSYNLYRGTETGVTPEKGTKINVGAVTSYSDTGREAGKEYFYVVTAVNANGESAASGQASATTPSAAVAALTAALTPPSLIAAPFSITQVSLTWSEVSGAKSYRIYYSTSAEVKVTTGTKIEVGSANSFIVSGLTTGTPYYFIVTAVGDGDKESASSKAVSATPSAAAPPRTMPNLTPH